MPAPDSIHDHAARGNLTAIQGLLTKVNPLLTSERDPETKRTPLHYAAEAGQKDVVALLLRFISAVHRLVDKGDEAFIEALKTTEKPDVNAKDAAGLTPLHLAAAAGQQHAVFALLAYKADFEARDHSQRTPLHLGAFQGDLEVVRDLIKFRADVNAVDAAGNTPLQYAVKGEHQKVADELRQHGAVTSDSLPAKPRKRGAKKEAILDLRKDKAPVQAVLSDAVASYVAKHGAAKSAKKHPPVTRIDFTFSLGDTESIPWVHLSFDTKPGSEPDGNPTHPDFAKLNRKGWRGATKASAEGQSVGVIKASGETKQCRGDQLYETVGNFLVGILLEARDRGVFASLPKAERCELGVEDPGTGAFGWPIYENRAESLV